MGAGSATRMCRGFQSWYTKSIASMVYLTLCAISVSVYLYALSTTCMFWGWVYMSIYVCPIQCCSYMANDLNQLLTFPSINWSKGFCCLVLGQF